MPRITVAPSAVAASAARIGYSSIIDGARSAGTSMPLQLAEAHAQVGDRLAPLLAPPLEPEVGAHLDQRRVDPGPRRVEPDAGQQHLRALDHQRRRHRERRRARVARHRDRLRPELGLAAQRDHPPLGGRLGPDRRRRSPLSIRSVWSRVASVSITTVSPGAFSPASSTADFTCAEGIGVVYCTGIGFARPGQRDRQEPAAPPARLGAEERQRAR